MTDREIKLVVLDFDGVISDGTVRFGESGEESKNVSFRDIMGISQLKRHQVDVVIISGEDSSIVDVFARKVGISQIVKGSKNKFEALQAVSVRLSIDLNEICYDINDVECLESVGFAAAPSNAHRSVLDVVDFVSVAVGGDGAVRELADHLIENRFLLHR